MQIFVNFMHKKLKITLDVESSDTISTVKAKVMQEEGITPNHYNLILAGKHLVDERTLADCNVQEEANLWVCGKFR